MKWPNKKIILMLFTGLLFIASRVVIWIFKPTSFSQIIYVYMPYAHLWADGYWPYLKQVYEYPPLTIPLFYIPHLIDMATNHTWYHLDYGVAYRGLMLLTDTGIFGLIALALRKMKVSTTMFCVSLTYYSLVTAKAHDFIYDSFDMVFIGVIVLGLVAPILWPKRSNFVGWLGYVSGVALKYVNAPLALPLFLIQRENWIKKCIAAIVAGLVIWGVPIVLFRSSMLVTFVYHQQRGLQIESAAATVARTIDQFTHTEHAAEVDKAYDIQGPVSSIVNSVSKVLFPVSLMLFILWVSWLTFKYSAMRDPKTMILITLGYVGLFMIVSPVLSTPYLLWHIPLVALLPTRYMKEKIALVLVSLAIVIAGMTLIPNVPLLYLTTHIWIGWVKIIGFSILEIIVVRQIKRIALI